MSRPMRGRGERWGAHVACHRLRRRQQRAQHALLLGAVALAAALRLSFALAGSAAAHAILVRSDPKAGAILQAPPSQVRLWFSESINPFTSKVVVIDPTNREVDREDSHRNPNNDQEMDVSLPLLPAGTYIVDWGAQSTDDGHISGGSFIFRIARPDGSVPPGPKVLPTGHFPGAAGAGVPGSSTIDPPTALQGLGTFLALLFMTFWVGGVIWETWILNPAGPTSARDPDVMTAARAAARRFARLAPYALGGVIVADVLMVLGQTAELAGSWQGAISPVLLGAILFGSRFGEFWWMRQVVALAALLLTVSAARDRKELATAPATSVAVPSAIQERGLSPNGRDEDEQAVPIRPIPDWRRELAGVLRGVPHLPWRLVRGWQLSSGGGRIACLLAGALLVAFALSGHAAAVPASEFAYAIGVDLFHMLCEAAWIGGLFYISVVLIPALGGLPALTKARVLALGLPEFSAVAIVSAVLLAATGSLNATVHLTSITQFLTTLYGKTLAIKIEIFLVMVAISAYHAFVLRPRLAAELRTSALRGERGGEASPVSGVRDTAGATGAEGADDAEGMREEERRLIGVWSAAAAPTRARAPSPTASPAGRTGRTPDAADGSDGTDGSSHTKSGDEDVPAPRAAHGAQLKAKGGTDALPARARALKEWLRDWLRREAILAAAVLLCVALLDIFAGSLTGPLGQPSGAVAAGSGGAVVKTQQSGGYAVMLKVTPDTFGRNDFTVTVKTAQGQPVDGAAVVITLTDNDMDMGTQTAQLQPIGPSAPGSYSGQADLTMAGDWQVAVKVLLPNVKQPLVTTFRFIATY